MTHVNVNGKPVFPPPNVLEQGDPLLVKVEKHSGVYLGDSSCVPLDNRHYLLVLALMMETDKESNEGVLSTNAVLITPADPRVSGKRL